MKQKRKLDEPNKVSNQQFATKKPIDTKNSPSDSNDSH